MASADDRKAVQLWDGATGASITSLEGHSGCVNDVTFSPDGLKIASGSDDYTIRLGDGATGASIASLEGCSPYVHHITFSPNGSKIAFASGDHTIQLWDSATGTFIASLTGHSNYIHTIAFSHDSMKIASACSDNTGRLWEAATGEPLSSEDDTFQFLAPLGYLSLSVTHWQYPSRHITGARLGNFDSTRIVPLCWFTDDMARIGPLADAGSHAAIGCEDRVTLFDLSNVHLD